MLNWLIRLIKGKELDQIAFLEDRLSEATKIANKKKVIFCYNKKCMDYDPETKGCTLDKIIIKPGGCCEDIDEGLIAKELHLEEGKNVFTIINDRGDAVIVDKDGSIKY